MLKPTTKEELKEILDIQNIKLYEIDTSLITDMSYLFDGIFWWDFEGINTWDTSNVCDMSYMFKGSEWIKVKLSFDTSNVTNMQGMFAGCESMPSEGIEFDTKSVTDMSYMLREYNSFNKKNTTAE